jgi:murein DD-endopeptidase MepM/ murein hydrolase activator NlpD
MRRFACVFVPVVVLVTTLSVPPARAAALVVFTPPVDAPVLDPFRAPAGPYGPGNRGIEYDTDPGDPVLAAAGGVVIFAGAVAGTLHVTVDHGAGLLSSYSFLDRVLARVGDTVARGDRIGLAGSTFHFGVRVNGEYVDPASMMGVMVVRVRLVSSRDQPGRRPAVTSRFLNERREIRALAMSGEQPATLVRRGGRPLVR